MIDWNAHVASLQALGDEGYPPWGELVGKNYILSLPSDVLLRVSNPGAVMDYWDRVVDTEDSLLGYPPRMGWRSTVGRAERFVVDIEISAGWMHSGYPIMAYQSVSSDQVSLSYQQGDEGWGPFHELGQKTLYVHILF